SLAGVAMRLMARTFEYDSSPRLKDAATAGSSPSRRATRTYSRAVCRLTPQRQLSQWAVERHSQSPAPERLSNSPISRSQRQVAAAMWAPSEQISLPRASVVIEGISVGNIRSILALTTDKI